MYNIIYKIYIYYIYFIYVYLYKICIYIYDNSSKNSRTFDDSVNFNSLENSIWKAIHLQKQFNLRLIVLINRT